MPSQEPSPPLQKQPRSISGSQSGGTVAAASQKRRQGSIGDLPPTSPSAVTFGSVNKGGIQKGHRQHVVGHNRGHPRPPSYGKNLNKLTKIVQNHGGDGAATGSKRHQRSQSHTPSTSPGTAQIKKVGSHVVLPRNGSHVSLKKNLSHTSLRQNLSSSSLKRGNQAADHPPKPARPDPARRRSLNNHPKQTAVRFDLGAADGIADDSGGWTEASSATESPAVTRPSTSGHNSSRAVSPPASRSQRMPDSPPASVPRDIPQQLTDRTSQRKSSSSNHRSTPPSADAITSRLLQRSQRGAATQTSNISATATPGPHSPGPHSPGSLGSTPITHPPGSLSPDSNRSDNRETVRGDSPTSRRSRLQYDPSTGVALAPTSHYAGGTPVNHHTSSNELYRTQQKIMLQRASIEPPTSSPHGGPGGMRSSPAAVNDGREMMRLWEHAASEYTVVRRWRSPTQEAVKRTVKGGGARVRIPPSSATVASRADGRGSLDRAEGGGRVGSSHGYAESGAGRRSDLPLALLGSSADAHRDGDEEEENTVEAMLRRIWERADIPIDRE